MNASTPNFDALAKQFDHDGVQSIVVMGSFSRNESNEFSDVDIVRFLMNNIEDFPDKGSHIIDKRLVVVSDVIPSEVEEWFTRPEIASNVIYGVRKAKIIIDRNEYFNIIQKRAINFVWDNAIQKKANEYASKEMVGYIEEVHKGLEGFKRGGIGRILNSRHGLSWGLCGIMQVKKGIFKKGDNSFFEEITQAMGTDSTWSKLCYTVFGVDSGTNTPPTLREQLIAGLKLYVLTANILKDCLNQDNSILVFQTVELINRELQEKI